MKTLSQIQDEIAEWSKKNFGDQESINPLLGIVEEVGELCHAVLKGRQGIRHNSGEIYDMEVDAIGDIMIYLLDYCSRRGMRASVILNQTWDKVQRRDWKKDPQGESAK